MEPPGFGKRLMSVLRAVYHMLRRGLCRKRLMMDLHLLLGRGKLAGRALRNLVAAAAAHHHPHSSAAHHAMFAARRHAAAGATAASSSSSSSSAAAAPTDDLPFVPNPQDVEFSCTTTPSYGDFVVSPAAARSLFPSFGRIRGRGAAAAKRGCDGLDFAQVARALEMMSAAEDAAGAGGEMPSAAAPSPMLALSLGRSPAGVRQLRVTDSPFPLEPEGVVDDRANSNFDAFINKFYENLRLQAANATPDNCVRRRA
ncbi:hypothetical protein HU200_030885 [Digitaria exilis]|uniref:Uncharacterized protein n=1 Tax=Digitaria exilis TaxID=1010633 RepID=A0A835BQP0_9POAL|nr:hypothetical protein HU200_030885 [Digitaria exilis]CAB3471850.1 unnamed protein product [Digitaria exilis]